MSKSDPLPSLIRIKMIRRYLMRRIILQSLKRGEPIHGPDELRQALADKGVNLRGLHRQETFYSELAEARVALVRHDQYAEPIYMPLPFYPERHEVTLDSELVTNEVLRRVTSHVKYIDRHKEWVMVNCEKMTGRMFAEPLFLLAWPEIKHIMPNDHSVVILCDNEDAAQRVHGRLLGD